MAAFAATFNPVGASEPPDEDGEDQGLPLDRSRISEERTTKQTRGTSADALEQHEMNNAGSLQTNAAVEPAAADQGQKCQKKEQGAHAEAAIPDDTIMPGADEHDSAARTFIGEVCEHPAAGDSELGQREGQYGATKAQLLRARERRRAMAMDALRIPGNGGARANSSVRHPSSAAPHIAAARENIGRTSLKERAKFIPDPVESDEEATTAS